MTERLYWKDAYAREFAARVLRSDGTRVVLDRTLFYPTSGGQPHDTGTVNGVRVLDVVEEASDIVHFLERPLEAAEAHGAIDWERRLDHMQQHDGQHILSEAFVRVCGAETTSFHLGPQTCTIDLDRNGIAAKDLEAAEELANRIVWENRPITAAFFTQEEIAKVRLRKPPQVDGSIRVVRVEDFDASACCGTHGRSTGETGVIQILGVDRAKGQPRVEFVCGWRAVKRARENATALRAIGAAVSSGREDVVAAVERLATEAAQARKTLASTERRLAQVHAVELQSAAIVRGRARFVVELIPDRDIKYLQAVASHIVTGAGYAVVLGGNVGGSCLLVARSQDLDVDVRPIGRDALAVIAGRGGGPAHMVQGGGSGANVREAMKVAEERLRAELQ